MTDEVWRYDNHQWDKYDNLVRPRFGHQSSLIGKNIVHIGGCVDIGAHVDMGVCVDNLKHFRFVADLN